MSVEKGLLRAVVCLVIYLIVTLPLVLIVRWSLRDRPDMAREEMDRLLSPKLLLAIGLPEALLLYIVECIQYGRLITGIPGLVVGMSFIVLVLGGLGVSQAFVRAFGPLKRAALVYPISMLVPTGMLLGRLLALGYGWKEVM